jgi:WD40 repeat protein
VWRTDTRQPVGPRVSTPGWGAALALSPDGRLVVQASHGGQLRVTAVATGEQVGDPWTVGACFGLAFDPSGARLLVARNPAGLDWWDVPSRKLLARTGVGGGGPGVVVRPDGKGCVSGGGGQTVQVCDADLKPVGMPLRHDGAIHAVALTPDGAELLTGAEDGTVRLWDVATGQPLGPRWWNGGPVRGAAFLGGPGRVATLSTDGAVRVFDVRPLAAALTREPPGNAGSTRIAFAPDRRHALTGGKGLRVWDLTTRQTVARLTDDASAAVFSPRPPRLFAAGSVYEYPSGAKAGGPVPVRGYARAAFTPDGTVLAVGLGDGGVTLYDGATASPLSLPPGDTGRGAVFDLKVSPDGRRVTAGLSNGEVRTWEVATGVPAGPPLKLAGRQVWAVAYSPDSRRLAAGNDQGSVWLWDAAGDRPVAQARPHSGGVTAAAFSPDGSALMTASADRTVRFWNPATGEPGGPVLAHAAPVTAAAFTPDGAAVVTRSKDGKAWLWDRETGRVVAGFFHPDEAVYAADVSPDGATVLTGSDTGVWTWPVPRPVGGRPQTVELWAQALTGLALDVGTVRALSGVEWQAVRRDLAAQGDLSSGEAR